MNCEHDFTEFDAVEFKVVGSPICRKCGATILDDIIEKSVYQAPPISELQLAVLKIKQEVKP